MTMRGRHFPSGLRRLSRLARSLRWLLAWLPALVACRAADPGPMSSVWIEAEDTAETNFIPGAGPSNISRQSPGVSGAAFLTLAAKGPEKGGLPFHAVWRFTVAEAGAYRLWAGVSPQDVDWASPFLLRCNDGPAISLENRKPASGVYGNPPRNQFGWVDAGVLHLEPGEHVLRLEVIRPRTSARDDLYHAFADAFLLTQELDYVPAGAYPKQSPHPPWEAVLGDTPLDEFTFRLQQPFYEGRLAASGEGVGEDIEREVVRKLMRRPLPGPEIRHPGRYQFGLHGMEVPFVRKGVDAEKIQRAYELLARVGVQSLRTAESCWHRLGGDYDNVAELDYQIASAARHGITQMFTVGYPPDPYRVSRGLSAVRPEHIEKYRDYLKTVLSRYAGRGVISDVELANEVDARNPWWVDSTPEMYVTEMRLVKEAVDRYAPGARAVAFGATYARNEQMGGPEGGRRFIRACFDLGIDSHVDAYSLHYTWKLSERDFPEFFRREARERGLPAKPLINSEETSHGHPSDIIKLFARDFLLHGMVRVDYFMSRDWFELGSVKLIGLFDLSWNPKRRLLAYAAAVDAIRHREFLGMAGPAAGIEAYVLRWDGEGAPPGAEYATVLWNDASDALVPVAGWRDIGSATDWKLDPVKTGADGTLQVGGKPLVVFSKSPPDWPLVSPSEWLLHVESGGQNIAPEVPL